MIVRIMNVYGNRCVKIVNVHDNRCRHVYLIYYCIQLILQKWFHYQISNSFSNSICVAFRVFSQYVSIVCFLSDILLPLMKWYMEEKCDRIASYNLTSDSLEILKLMVQGLKKVERKCRLTLPVMLRLDGHCGQERCLIFMSLRICLAFMGQHDLPFKKLIKGNNAINEICQLSQLSLNICLHSMSCSSKSRYRHYASSMCVNAC